MKLKRMFIFLMIAVAGPMILVGPNWAGPPKPVLEGMGIGVGVAMFTSMFFHPPVSIYHRPGPPPCPSVRHGFAPPHGYRAPAAPYESHHRHLTKHWPFHGDYNGSHTLGGQHHGSPDRRRDSAYGSYRHLEGRGGRVRN